MSSAQAAGQAAEAEVTNGRVYKCPDCGQPVHFMGLDFKAPRKADKKAWRDVEAFVLAGHVYYRKSREG